MKKDRINWLIASQYGFYLIIISALWLFSLDQYAPITVVLLNHVLLFVMDDWGIISSYTKQLKGRILWWQRIKVDLVNILLLALLVPPLYLDKGIVVSLLFVFIALLMFLYRYIGLWIDAYEQSHNLYQSFKDSAEQVWFEVRYPITTTNYDIKLGYDEPPRQIFISRDTHKEDVVEVSDLPVPDAVAGNSWEPLERIVEGDPLTAPIDILSNYDLDLGVYLMIPQFIILHFLPRGGKWEISKATFPNITSYPYWDTNQLDEKISWIKRRAQNDRIYPRFLSQKEFSSGNFENEIIIPLTQNPVSGRDRIMVAYDELLDRVLLAIQNIELDKVRGQRKIGYNQIAEETGLPLEAIIQLNALLNPPPPRWPVVFPKAIP